MHCRRHLVAACALFVGALSMSASSEAQQIRGTPGAPSTVMTLPGLQLPAPTPQFSGAIQPNAVDSTPAWPPQIMPPANAPNVLLILTDDVGFGAPSTFGGVIPTPTLDRVAADGLRYTSFHTTALCSPTRSALLQGGRFGGWGFYLKDGRPTFTMNLLNVERPKWQAREALKPGRHTIVFDFALEQKGEVPFGHGGTGVMSVDGQEAARITLPHTTPFTFAWDETFDVGMDTGTAVDDKDYQTPFVFSGKLEKITVDLGEGPVSEESMTAWMKAISTRDVERAAPGVSPPSHPAAPTK